MKKYRLLIVLLILVIGTTIVTVFKLSNSNPTKKIEWTIETLPVNDGWGYIISQNGVPTIQQNRIPTLPKSFAFPSEQSALLVGNKVLEKLKNNTLPSILQSELIELGVVDSLLNPIR